jgi:hypothetical protein
MAKKKTGDEPVVKLGVLYMSKDPRVYEQGIPRVVRPHKRIVGLDLANRTGVGFVDIVPGLPVNGAKIVLGQWDLSTNEFDSGPLRHIRLKQFLAVMAPDLVMLEDVKYTGANVPEGMTKFNVTAMVARAVTGAQFIHGLKVTVSTWCEERGIPCHGLPIGQIKKFATGKGNAGKPDMIAACNEQLGTDFDPKTFEQTGVDNMADAAFCCAMGVQLYSEGLTGPSVALPTESMWR